MRCTDRLRHEGGMTLIELMVAATICVVGVMSTIMVLDTSRQISVKAEHREAMAHQGERELERVMELPWAEFAHKQNPASSPTAGNPANYVNGNTYAYDRSSPGATEPFALEPVTGAVEHTSAAWTDGQTRLGGRVYRFVTQKEPNARRVTIVVTGTGAKAPPPILLSSIKTIPDVD